MKVSQLVIRIFGIVLGLAMVAVGIVGLAGEWVWGYGEYGTSAPSSSRYGADFYTDTAEFLEVIGANTYTIANNTAGIENSISN